jgi:hypothetical protein
MKHQEIAEAKAAFGPGIHWERDWQLRQLERLPLTGNTTEEELGKFLSQSADPSRNSKMTQTFYFEEQPIEEGFDDVFDFE